jgi:hypothetical protein
VETSCTIITIYLRARRVDDKIATMDAGEFINNAMEDLENQGAWLQPPSSPPQSLSKERRQPSITPRKFRRFFTPRSHDQLARHPSRTPLGDITEPLHHRHGVQSSPLRAHAGRGARESSPTVFTRDMKRRKLLHVSSPSIDGICGTKSPASSLFGDLETHTILDERDSSPTLRSLPPLDEAEEEPLPILRQHRPRKALKYIAECLTSDLLARCGGSTSRVRHQHSRRPVAGKAPFPIPIIDSKYLTRRTRLARRDSAVLQST